MTSRDDDRFRVQPGPPKSPKSRQPGGGQRFVSRVLREANKAGAKPSQTARAGGRSTAKLGRGQVAAQTAGRRLGPGARRVVIKARYLVLRQAGARSVETHLRYIEREGVDRDGLKGNAYGPTTDRADLADFEERGRGDRHQFRFIVSPEDAQQLEDLRGYTRHLMTRMEGDLGSSLNWVAVDHWNTDNPHTHVVLRGRDQAGQDLIIARDYIATGMRQRACELATEWLGPRTEREIREGLQREVGQERWTSLDRSLQKQAQQSPDGVVELAANSDAAWPPRMLLIGRLQRLTDMGLAQPDGVNRWRLRPDIEPTLRAMGERGDIVRTMQRAFGSRRREMVVFTPGKAVRPVVGRVVGKGLADELQERGYLVLDGIDGRAHYVALPAGTELEKFPVGAVVEARGAAEERVVDKTIAGLAEGGLYRTAHHVSVLGSQPARSDPQETVAAHVRRLEVLRRAGLVERVAEGVWRVSADLPERARQYDSQRLAGGSVTLHSRLPIERQTRVIGATWLDRQLIGGAAGVADKGFGGELRDALRQRTDFLIEQGLAERRDTRVSLARNLLGTLKQRDLNAAARSVADETRLLYRPTADGERVSGVYRRDVLLASGRFAMLDDGLGFSLVPWRPVIEQRLGQQLTATVRGTGISWRFGHQRGLSV
jgi:type IV secretory pathway VirD2 relaxase